jgi:hypothetical protein
VKVFVYVEGDADRLALEALLHDYRERLRAQGHGLQFIVLDDKAKLLRKIGHRAAEKLVEDAQDCVVALPDLYPPHLHVPEHRYRTFAELRAVMRSLVKEALQSPPFGIGPAQAESMLLRFYPCALKQELETLLLAAWRQLGDHIGVTLDPGRWRHPVEEQNLTKEGRPKQVVEDLFLTRKEKKHAYRDTKDAPAILRQVRNIREELLMSTHGQLECPVFKGLLDWLSTQTRVPVLSPD